MKPQGPDPRSFVCSGGACHCMQISLAFLPLKCTQNWSVFGQLCFMFCLWIPNWRRWWPWHGYSLVYFWPRALATEQLPSRLARVTHSPNCLHASPRYLFVANNLRWKQDVFERCNLILVISRNSNVFRRFKHENCGTEDTWVQVIKDDVLQVCVTVRQLLNILNNLDANSNFLR